MRYAAKFGPGFSMSPFTSWIKSQVLEAALETEPHMPQFLIHVPVRRACKCCRVRHADADYVLSRQS